MYWDAMDLPDEGWTDSGDTLGMGKGNHLRAAARVSDHRNGPCLPRSASSAALNRIDIESASWILAAVVLIGSIVQACFESGENARYSLPFQSLIIAYVVIAAAPYFARCTSG